MEFKNNKNFLILNYYRPQNGINKHGIGSRIDLLYKEIQKIINKKKYNNYKILLCGDANAHHDHWMKNKIKNRSSNAKKNGDI